MLHVVMILYFIPFVVFKFSTSTALIIVDGFRSGLIMPPTTITED